LWFFGSLWTIIKGWIPGEIVARCGSLEIFFTDPDEIPLPPQEVRIRDLKVVPYPDGRRVRLRIELTPFQKYPSGEILITDGLGNPIASASFVEAITPKLEMTLHLRSLDPDGQYNIDVTLFYSQEIEDQSLLKTVDTGAVPYDNGTQFKPIVNGWARVDWNPTGSAVLCESGDCYDDATLEIYTDDWFGLLGMPVTGFWAEQFENGFLGTPGASVLANYGGLFQHSTGY